MRRARAPGRVAAVLLAAGGSRRLGRAKQLLEIGGEALVRRAARAVLGCGADETLVVTGAHSDEVVHAVADLGLRTVDNRAWAEGIASSIRCGTRAAEALGCSAVLIVLADQPYVGSEILARIVDCYREERRQLVASQYRGIAGAPALFAGRHRARLLQLEGDCGARHVLRACAPRVRLVSFEAGAVDIDDEESWRSVAADAASPWASLREEL
jgi:CTP:molybdopterin cytidylyltransferase MocA